jgi:L-alanine-DL-glutamate epimerase-like enolase superfamily enzyme
LGASQAGTAAVLETIAKRLVGRDAFAIEANMDMARRSIRGNNPAKGAVDCALHDLAARLLEVPLYKLLGGKTRSKLPLLRILSIKSPDQMQITAQKLIDEGYRYLKLKVEGNPREDANRVRAVRKVVGDDIFISVDPNMGFTAKAAIEFARRIEDCGVTMMEQPLPDSDVPGLESVTRAVELPIEADESATTVEQVLDLAAYRRVDAVNLKIPRSGGILSVITMSRICEAAGLQYRLGANVGSRLLAAHALHVAAALPNVHFACELAEFERLQNDPYEGLEVIDGEIHVSDEIGTGVRRRAA